MNPLQLFLIRTFDSDPAGAVPLVELIRQYLDTLDGSEDPRWRERAHIVRTLGRTFPVGIYCDQRCVAGLSPKSAAKSVVANPAPIFVGGAKCQS